MRKRMLNDFDAFVEKKCLVYAGGQICVFAGSAAALCFQIHVRNCICSVRVLPAIDYAFLQVSQT